jgi:hypothetical protein
MNAQDYTITRNAFRVFGVPAVLAIASAAGLISALLGDGIWDMLSWFALGAPLTVIAWFGARAAGFMPQT